MKRSIAIILLLALTFPFLQSCKNISAFNKQGNDDPDIPVSEHLAMAVLYQQTAAEYRALCYQAFNIATHQLNQNLRIMGLQKQQAVVVDIDETVLDNSPHEAKCILNNDIYPAYWEEWINAIDAKPVPGSLKFLQYAESKGFEVYYVTNRKEKYRQQTLENLKKVDFPFADNDHLYLRTDESSKEARRKKISETKAITMLIGDNLNDFANVFEKKSVTERFILVDEMKTEFGSRFIVLPNAMYGAWEGALYDYDYSVSAKEKDNKRLQNLIDF